MLLFKVSQEPGKVKKHWNIQHFKSIAINKPLSVEAL